MLRGRPSSIGISITDEAPSFLPSIGRSVGRSVEQSRALAPPRRSSVLLLLPCLPFPSLPFPFCFPFLFPFIPLPPSLPALPASFPSLVALLGWPYTREPKNVVPLGSSHMHPDYLFSFFLSSPFGSPTSLGDF